MFSAQYWHFRLRFRIYHSLIRAESNFFLFIKILPPPHFSQYVPCHCIFHKAILILQILPIKWKTLNTTAPHPVPKFVHEMDFLVLTPLFTIFRLNILPKAENPVLSLLDPVPKFVYGMDFAVLTHSSAHQKSKNAIWSEREFFSIFKNMPLKQLYFG